MNLPGEQGFFSYLLPIMGYLSSTDNSDKFWERWDESLLTLFRHTEGTELSRMTWFTSPGNSLCLKQKRIYCEGFLDGI